MALRRHTDSVKTQIHEMKAEISISPPLVGMNRDWKDFREGFQYMEILQDKCGNLGRERRRELFATRWVGLMQLHRAMSVGMSYNIIAFKKRSLRATGISD